MRSNSSSLMSKNGVAELMPAPLTTTSTRPLRSSTASSRPCVSALLVASAEWNHALPPAAAIVSRRALALSALRPTRTTSAPAPARPSAMAPQSSPVPPMTTATLPDSEKSDSR